MTKPKPMFVVRKPVGVNCSSQGPHVTGSIWPAKGAKHAAALQFDHTGPKTAAISQIRTSKSRVLAEIKRGKCVVRCANCHAVKTWERKQSD